MQNKIEFAVYTIASRKYRDVYEFDYARNVICNIYEKKSRQRVSSWVYDGGHWCRRMNIGAVGYIRRPLFNTEQIDRSWGDLVVIVRETNNAR